jgi:hypothetical protein
VFCSVNCPRIAGVLLLTLLVNWLSRYMIRDLAFVCYVLRSQIAQYHAHPALQNSSFSYGSGYIIRFRPFLSLFLTRSNLFLSLPVHDHPLAAVRPKGLSE